jgi:nucleoside-diphosphate-sugar epimerase
MIELARFVPRFAGGVSRFSFKPLPRNDPKWRRPATSLAQQRSGWKPVVDLEDGLNETTTYQRMRIDV